MGRPDQIYELYQKISTRQDWKGLLFLALRTDCKVTRFDTSHGSFHHCRVDKKT